MELNQLDTLYYISKFTKIHSGTVDSTHKYDIKVIKKETSPKLKVIYVDSKRVLNYNVFCQNDYFICLAELESWWFMVLCGQTPPAVVLYVAVEIERN